MCGGVGLEGEADSPALTSIRRMVWIVSADCEYIASSGYEYMASCIPGTYIPVVSYDVGAD